MYLDYIKERQPDKLIEKNEKGFALWSIIEVGSEKAVYIEDIYTVPTHRRSRAATQIANIVASKAKEMGCTIMLGTVNPSASGSTESLKSLLSYDMKLLRSENNIIWFSKEI